METAALAEHQDNARWDAPPANRGFVAEDSPDSEQPLSSGLDGGTELTNLVTQALPFPDGPVRQQLAAPCPEGIEEINGYCWLIVNFATVSVKAGACNEDGVYEPSEGWCRAHHAGYRPFRGTRRKNNTVDPQ